LTYRVDAAELLGGIVRAYFEERRNDRPLDEEEEEERESNGSFPE
jgi:hypothetical protein